MKKRIRTFYKLNESELSRFSDRSSNDILSRTIFSDKLMDKPELKNDIEKLMISFLNEIWINGKDSELIPEILRNLDNKLPYSSADMAINTTESECKTDDTITENKHEISSYKVGDTITFGNYNNRPIEWYVADVEEERVLLVSVDCVKNMHYDIIPQRFNSWKKSKIRDWLNIDFINIAFSDKETEKILFRDENTDYIDTIYADRIFILSAEEAKKFMNNDMLKLGYWWWLRGEGGYFVPVVNEKGRINNLGYNTDNPNGGVRPAMYVKI